MYKTQKGHQQWSHHAPPQTRDDQRFNFSKPCKNVHDFTKLTLQGSCTALELQNLKISGPETQTHAATRLLKLRKMLPKWNTRLHQLLRAYTHWRLFPTYHALPRAIPWHAPQLYDVVDDVSRPGLTGLEIWPESEPPAKKNLIKKKKWEKKCFD